MKKNISLTKKSINALLVIVLSMFLLAYIFSFSQSIKAKDSVESISEFQTVEETGIKLEQGQINVVGFTAKWCSLCSNTNKYAPMISKEYSVNYQLIDIDEYPNSRNIIDSRELPVFMIFNDQNELVSEFGFEDKEGFEKRLLLVVNSN